MDEQDPFLPPSAASQAIAARTLRNQGSYNAPPSSTSSLKRFPSPRNVIEPSPSMSHRYTPLNTNPFALNLPSETKDFQKFLRTTPNVYYDSTVPETKKLESKSSTLKRDFKGLQEMTQDVSSNYEYYSSIPVNINLTSQQRGWNYSNRDNEFSTNDAPPWVGSARGLHSQNSTLESTWSPTLEDK